MNQEMQHTGMPAYRADIDGLRALAVLAVVLFHAKVPGFGGGYVGVDVFFVISGYLITQLLLASRADQQPRMLKAFYVRRARRILPALLFTCAVIACVAWWLLLPEDLVYLGKHVAAAPLLLSNLAAWSDGGYFATNQQAPLGHLWSIAVEEQFYLLYPLLLLLLARYLPRRRGAALAVLALLSFLLCVWASQHRPGANYYLAATRAWELLLGAVLALAPTSRVRPRLVDEALAGVSLLLLVAVTFGYDAQLPYPGLYALPPCLATVGLIASGRTRVTHVKRMLAWPPLVFLGLISYSLYLWHQPLLQWVRYWHVTPLPPMARITTLAAIGVLAALSWRYIEQPVRARTFLRGNASLALGALFGSALVCALGLLLWYSDGYPRRLAPEMRAFLGSVDPESMRDIEHCMMTPLVDIRAGHICSYGNLAPGVRSFLVWGDSHALALLPAYRDLAARENGRLYFVATSSCRPLLGVINVARPPQGRDKCVAFNTAVVSAVRQLNPEAVILGGFWMNDQLARAPPAGAAAQAESAFASGLRQTVAAVSGAGRRRVCLVLDVPLLPYAASYALVMAHRRGIADDFIGVSRSEAYAQSAQLEREVRRLAGQGLLQYVDPKQLLCTHAQCLYKAQGRSLYYDGNHLSEFGARYVSAALAPCFAARTEQHSEQSAESIQVRGRATLARAGAIGGSGAIEKNDLLGEAQVRTDGRRPDLHRRQRHGMVPGV